jgi:hypothetical protein
LCSRSRAQTSWQVQGAKIKQKKCFRSCDEGAGSSAWRDRDWCWEYV